jgi:hypothetical protein
LARKKNKAPNTLSLQTEILFMLPDAQLSIYELRAPSPQTRDLMAKYDLRAILGPDLLGYHFEEDFAFLFCLSQMDLRALDAIIPGLELREVHRLRYDEWQDGAGASPIFLGPLAIVPFEDGREYPEELFGEDDAKTKDDAGTQDDAGTKEGWNREGTLTGDGLLLGDAHNEKSLNSTKLRELRLSMGLTTELKAGDLMGYPKLLPPLIIDPGLAFGYGGHHTTKACLSFLLRVMSPNNGNRPKSFLDLGTGTGVLSLAAIRLGGERALGVDYSHLAAQNAIFNGKLNRLQEKVRFIHGLAGDYAKTPAELLLANIPLAVHLELLEKGAYLNRNYLILSGLLPREADQLMEKLKEILEFKMLDNHRDDRWSSWLLEVTGERS